MVHASLASYYCDIERCLCADDFNTHWVKISSEARQTAPLKGKQQIIVRTCYCTNAAENKICQVQVTAHFKCMTAVTFQVVLSHGLTCSVRAYTELCKCKKKATTADDIQLEPSLQSFFWLASFLYQRLQLLLVRQNLKEIEKKRYVVVLAADVLIVPVLPLLDFLL